MRRKGKCDGVLVGADSPLSTNRGPLQKLITKLEELNIASYVESLGDISEAEKQVKGIIKEILLQTF